jgi:translocator assembly and maintenance protein 41
MTVPSDAFFEYAIRSLPAVDYAVAYGSGVFPQEGDAPAPAQAALDSASAASPATKMIDLLLAVHDPIGWHAANLSANRSHYSALGLLGAPAVSAVQRCSVGGRVYFNTLVPYRAGGEHRLIKYGVIGMDDLEADLRGWHSLYVSGRLHKPVRTLVPSARLQPSLDANLRSALAAGLLCLPSAFSDLELFCAISNLSYQGDVRMLLRAEDPRKVPKLVAPALCRFQALYRQPLEACAPDLRRGSDGRWSQPVDAGSTASRLLFLPPAVRARVVAAAAPSAGGVQEGQPVESEGRLEERLAAVPREAVQHALQSCLSRVVLSASVAQSAKGLLTAGVAKSSLYLLRKLRKGRS